MSGGTLWTGTLWWVSWYAWDTSKAPKDACAWCSGYAQVVDKDGDIQDLPVLCAAVRADSEEAAYAQVEAWCPEGIVKRRFCEARPEGWQPWQLGPGVEGTSRFPQLEGMVMP